MPLLKQKPICKLAKVISGGQLGADIAGLYAAEESGITTGGWMPKGFRRLDGLGHLWMRSRFGMKEHDSEDYPPRTNENVLWADATIRFACNFTTPGEVCTMKAINLHRKPFKDIWVDPDCNIPRIEIQEIVDWIRVGQFKILNVAGNSPKNCPGVFDFTHKFLLRVFASLQNKRI